ncbi:hypothetical protein EG329_013670 [Mollisiaceae sp. DMI_Dod_QoI]|nr:hypothetical protein EG329_013670 [Helotiales sp. DMI_Dod_QoI]
MDFDISDDEASAMAAAMGFSSFGSHKPPAKKRKFNPATDAFVSGQELETIDRGGKKGKGSGGNTMPLGKVRQFGGQKSASVKDSRNEDEITLDDEDEEDGGAAMMNTDLSTPTKAIDSAAKRPKFKPPTDNFASGKDRERVDRGGRKKGTNDETAPLEKNRRVDLANQKVPIREIVQNGGNDDEIDLEDEDEGPAYIDTSEPAPLKAAPPPDLEAIEVQARIDALLASIEEGVPPEQEPILDVISETLLPPPPRNLPNRPTFDNPPPVFTGFGGRGPSRNGPFSDTASVASSRPSQRGEKNLRWFVDYYDPSFNENPWKRLEAEMGLESVGSWLVPQERSMYHE